MKYNRLLVDITSSSSIRWNTGVQRVARGLALASVRSSDGLFGSRHTIFFDSNSNSYKFMPRILEWIGLPPNCRNWPMIGLYLKKYGRPVNFVAGDFIMLVDVCWHFANVDSLKKAKSSGATIFWLLYDIIPLRFPGETELNNEIRLREWVLESLSFVDVVCAISNSVATDYRQYLIEIGYIRKFPQIIYTHLAPSIKRAKLPIFRGPKSQAKYILCVGTLEPRKNYQYVLKAFEEMWRSSNASWDLKIVGTAKGWGGPEIHKLLSESQFLGTNFHLLIDVSDKELRRIYQNASALLSASKAEGFGLPILEAQSYGLPLILSNIPAHNEVAKGDATYFELSNFRQLTQILQNFGEQSRAEKNCDGPRSWNTTYSMIMGQI